MAWTQQGLTYELGLGANARARVDVDPRRPVSVQLLVGQAVLATTADGEAYPSAPIAVRRADRWATPTGALRAQIAAEVLGLEWSDGVLLTLKASAEGGLELSCSAPAADAVALALACDPTEHFYGLGERFDRLDQRGQMIELWVTNQASGTGTYKPVPFVFSSRGYGLVVDTTRRVHCAPGHLPVPTCTTVTVDGPQLHAALLPGPTPAAVLDLYTRRVGRPPVPPEWVFGPWKSRDWRTETQATAREDIQRHAELGIALGVKLIDATWEPEGHSFTFDSAKYSDPSELIDTARAAGVRVVLWLSPSMTLGATAYAEAAARGFLIRDGRGQPYVHRLGNEPGWVGTAIDFTHPPAVVWWQAQLRRLLELGVRGFKTDFGEQIPRDAVFADGRTGAQLHNIYPVLYNQATWAVVREYDGILLARSAWAGSQPLPGLWAGDQTSDFSPWSGLPSAIVAGQSAGWSGFPYWGSDIGGYFGNPDDEVFVRWSQFAAFTPIMEIHGLGIREPWLFRPATLEAYRRFANLHTRLAPYTRAAGAEALRTGLPLMRAMALCFPEDPVVHEDWVQYQYLYGPDLLVAPVYSAATTRQAYVPDGEWIDYFSGARVSGPSAPWLPAPLDAIPVFVRAGTVLPLLRDIHTSSTEALELQLFPGGCAERLLADDTRIVLESEPGPGVIQVRVSGPERDYSLSVPYRPLPLLTHASRPVTRAEGRFHWRGDVTLRLSS